ncbi:MAG: hypothetical protein DRQ44_03340 [Gammaproteobacteria bacterium]|nr:MAG: hypothetical protein DRQ44_03340 [Gammaproteobacteria bacterium]
MFQYMEKPGPYRASDDKAIENKASMRSIRSTGLLKIKAANYTQIAGIPHHVCEVLALQADW